MCWTAYMYKQKYYIFWEFVFINTFVLLIFGRKKKENTSNKADLICTKNK